MVLFVIMWYTFSFLPGIHERLYNIPGQPMGIMTDPIYIYIMTF